MKGTPNFCDTILPGKQAANGNLIIYPTFNKYTTTKKCEYTEQKREPGKFYCCFGIDVASRHLQTKKEIRFIVITGLQT